MESTSTQIRVERDGELAILILDGVRKRNAVGRQARGDLQSAVRRLMHHENDVKAIVLTGAGDHFCAGADVQEFTQNTILRSRFNLNESGETVRELAGGPKPVVAAVEGIAYGMGLSLAVSCDFLVASRSARMCAVFARIGLIPDTGIFWTLPRKIGGPQARELLGLTREVAGEDVVNMGLADRLVDAGSALQEAKVLARQLAALPSLAVAYTKSALTFHTGSLDEALRTEIFYQPTLRRTSDHQEAARALWKGANPCSGEASMTRPTNELVQVRKVGFVAVVTMNEPARRNPFSSAMRSGLLSTLQRLMDEDEEVRAIVLTGAGGQFCAGGDLSEMTSAPPILELRERIAVGTRLARVIVAGAKPVIAAIEGDCMGPGVSLAAACDIAVGSRSSAYECSYLKLGLMPDTGMLWTLQQKVGGGKAREMMLLPRRIDGTEAARLGLLAAVTEPGGALEAAITQAERLAELPPVTLMLMKGALVYGMNDLTTAMRHEIDLNPLVRTTHDHKEAVAALREKRKAQLRGE